MFDHLVPTQVVYRGEPQTSDEMREYCLRLSDLTINRRLFSVAEKSYFDNTTLKIYLPHVDEPTQTYTPLSASAVSRFRKIELYIFESHEDMCLSSQDECLDQYLKRIQEILATLAQQPQSKSKPRSIDVFFLTSQYDGRYLADYHRRQLVEDFSDYLYGEYGALDVDQSTQDFEDYAACECRLLQQMVDTRFAVYEDEAFTIGGAVNSDALRFRRKVLASLRKVHESQAYVTRAARAPLAYAHHYDGRALLQERLYEPDMWDKWAHDVPDKKLRCACRLCPDEDEKEHLARCSKYEFEQYPDVEMPEYINQTRVTVGVDWFLERILDLLIDRAKLFWHGINGLPFDIRPVVIEHVNQSPLLIIRRIEQSLDEDSERFEQMIDEAEEAVRKEALANGDTSQQETDQEMASDEETDESAVAEPKIELDA